jgi:hypothetical protein
VDYQLLSLDQPGPDVISETPNESEGFQTFMLVTRRKISGEALNSRTTQCEIQYYIFKKYTKGFDESSKGRQDDVPLFDNKDFIGSICVRRLSTDPSQANTASWDDDQYLNKFKETDFP